MLNQSDFKGKVSEIKNDIQAWRHHIHANPELSFEEFETANFVEEKLKSFGIESKRMSTTGVIAYIKADYAKRTVALRADLDALPIVEQNDTSYVSNNKGVMHACGHDVHTSSLLGAAKILKEFQSELKSNVKLIFQPGEEKLPGGASLLIKEGVLDDVDCIIGQHVMPLIDAGSVGFREGLYMASADEIYIDIIGKGGHGAMPHMAVDSVAITAQIITALQQVVSRMAKPNMPSVLTFGRIIGEGATNVIPPKVSLQGTFRTFDETWRMEAHQQIKKIAEGIAEAFGAKAMVDIQVGYPFLKNDVSLSQEIKGYAQEYLPKENVEDLDLWMAGEDFAFYSQKIPASFYRLGVRNTQKGIVHSVHHPKFDIDESALAIGSGLMAWLAYRLG